MQEKFVLKTLKKVAAIGTGVAMAGATLTGALALDLADYPSPYVVDGTYDDSTALVVGDNANAADTLGMVDIATNLQFEAKTAVESDSTTVSVTGGKTEKVPLSTHVAASTFFDTSLQDDDVSNFFDGTVSFQGKDYDTSEEMQFLSGGPILATSLNSSDDDIKSDIYMEMPARDIVKFYYKFDESVNLSTASSSQPFEMSFMGDNLKITNFDAAGTKFTAYVGEEHYMMTDESVTIDVDGVEKTVTLDEAGSTSVVVSVDGVTEIINTGSSQIVNGVEISVDSSFSRTERAESSAVLILGKQSSETYQDADPYIGEPTDGTADWVWDLAGLRDQGTSQTFGIENDFLTNDFDDDPTGVGECLNLPNDYVQVCYDSLTVSSTDYATYEFELDENIDASRSFGSGNTSLDGIYLHTSVSEGIELPAITSDFGAAANNTAVKKTDKVWLYYMVDYYINGSATRGGTNTVNILYVDPSEPGVVRWHGSVAVDVNGSNAHDVMLKINYGNTKDTNLQLRPEFGGTNTFNLTLQPTPDSSADMVTGDNLTLEWGLSTDVYSLGNTRSSEEAGELIWNGAAGATGAVTIGTKDEDHRTSYGVIVKNPKSNGASETVELSIPNDQVFANIVVKGTSSTVTDGGTTYVPAEITPATKLASEISSPADYQLILVGGPCANDLVEGLFDMTCDGWSFESGEAVIKLAENGNNVAMLVAGTTADDTRRASKVVANYADYTLAGTEVLVTGTSMEDITVGEVVEEEAVVEDETATDETTTTEE